MQINRVLAGLGMALTALLVTGFASEAQEGMAVIADKAAEAPRRWCVEVSLERGAFTIEVDERSFSFRGDESDPGQILIGFDGQAPPVKYRLWPDMAGWQLEDKWKAHYAKEFAALPGWRHRVIRVCVDADRALRRVWVDGRLVRSWQAADASAFRLAIAQAGQQTPPPAREIEAGMGRFLELDLDTYFNAGSDTAHAPGAFIELEGPAKLRYASNATEHRNLDLGKITYRDEHLDKGPFQHLSYPYLVCDAMSSDPQRAIFRVPARFYDRLHLLCYADGDAGEVPRAALRFMKVERARFYTREFGVEADHGVRVLEELVIGGKRCAHVVVDLNPAAFQEFVTEPENEFLEFELTRPVVMDSNSFEHPAGPLSSIHVIAMALEEAPVTMTVTSKVPGHLFERAEDAVMRIRFDSNCDAEVSGAAYITVRKHDGEIQDVDYALHLAAHGDKTLNFHVSDAPVGTSALVVRLEVADSAGDTRVLERETSFAILPKFERKAEDSPFGMWSFFEGHHGADIETTCELLRKAGVKGTLTNFILGIEPSTWEENARRTELLRQYGLVPNWSYLAGIANTALDGLGDMDTKFAWVKAHPQATHYNLFWETNVSRRAPRICPPEIRGQAPMEWNEEEQQRINTYLEFGKTWAARARQDAPDIKLCFGSGFPDFTAAMLGAGFPLEYIDGLGLDFDMYMSAPEDQPSMWYAPFSGIYYLRELRKVYQCEDKPIWLTEAIYCPTSPIWISERQQADYYVRAHLLGLAMGVERFGMCAEPIDPDGWYHYSHYGPVGLCHASPEVNPREAFCAYAAMTGVLDGAAFDAMVDLGSPHAYGVRYRKADGNSVHAFWTVNGERELRVQFEGKDAFTVYNRDGRDITQNAIDRQRKSGLTRLTLHLDESPVYLVGPRDIQELKLLDCETVSPPRGAKTLVRFRTLEGWEAASEPVEGYEELNRSTPIAWANLDLQAKGGGLNVRSPESQKTHPLETLCMVVRRTGDAPEIPADAKAIGVNVRADRSWGRVVYMLQDANGNQWYSAFSQTPIDVDGRVYLETPLPKAPSESNPAYQNYGPWRREKGDVIPEYPMRLTGLLLETRTHAIHGPDLVPLSRDGFTIESIAVRD
ncbi:MAG: hypothetical protein IT365_12470 [Candidatus Hydrogenedentes bacterium]|nr:hypothetical protein [Candidatus Hydrogenedentota bacterium]